MCKWGNGMEDKWGKTVAFTPFETPVGQYNRDWALMLRGDQTLHFAAGIRSTGADKDFAGDLLRPIERKKPECGKRHFRQFEEVRFWHVASLAELVR